MLISCCTRSSKCHVRKGSRVTTRIAWITQCELLSRGTCFDKGGDCFTVAVKGTWMSFGTDFVPPRQWLATFFCSADTCVVSASSLHSRGGFYVVTLVFCVFWLFETRRQENVPLTCCRSEYNWAWNITDAGITDCDTSLEGMTA